MTSVGPGSGQQHLLALLHAMRLKLDAETALPAAAPAVRPSPGTPATPPAPPAAHPPAAPPGTPVVHPPGTPVVHPPGTPAVRPPAAHLPAVPLPLLPVINPLPGPAPTPGVVPPVPPPAPPGPPVDGMSPADTLHLRELQRLLRTSLGLAGPIEQVCARLRDALVQAVPQLVDALPGTAASQQEQLRAALTWLVDNLDDPPVLVAGCGQLGGALREFGVQPQQLQLIGAALAEAMRAGMPGTWRQDYDSAWRTTWQHAHSWIAHGEQAAAYRPISWTAVVVGHERRRPDLAVLRVRPYLPMPYRPGQFARIETSSAPGSRRPYSLVGTPRLDNLVELHVRAKSEAGVSGALVHETAVGDRVQIGPAEGAMGLPPASDRGLLLIAGDTGLAPFKAMLIELAATGDQRPAVLFWGARTLDDLYDMDELAAITRLCRQATVIPVIEYGDPGPYLAGLVSDAVADYGEWSQHEVFIAGPVPMLAATIAVLGSLGIPRERIHHDAPES